MIVPIYCIQSSLHCGETPTFIIYQLDSMLNDKLYNNLMAVHGSKLYKMICSLVSILMFAVTKLLLAEALPHDYV